jgi:hypothetical protein
MIEAATVISGAEAVKTAEDAVSVIGRLVNKLRAHPDLAALKLSEALNEIMKTYLVVDEAFNTYFSLAEKGALKSRTKDLYAISGGRLTATVAAGKGDCYKIYVIYRDYLDKWFAKVFNKTDLEEMRDAFQSPGGLSDTDDSLFDALGQIAEQLEQEARGLIKQVQTGKGRDARRTIMTTYETLAPIRAEMSATIRQMYELKNEFDKIALGSFRA